MDWHVTHDKFWRLKQACFRWIFETKAGLLLLQKQACFRSIFEAKAGLLLVDFWSKSSAQLKKKIIKIFGGVLFFPENSGKSSTAFVNKNGPKAALLLPNYWTKSCGHQSGHQSISLVSVVQSGHVTPFFASTESQESKSEVGSRNRTRQCALRPILRPHLYLWCPWSNLDMWHHFLHLLNLRNSFMTTARTTERGIVL